MTGDKIRTSWNHDLQDDQQCHRIRNGNSRTGRTDHDLADYGTCRIWNHRPDQDTADPDHPPGSHHPGYLRIMRKKGWIKYGDMKLDM